MEATVPTTRTRRLDDTRLFCGLCDNRAVTTIADVRLCETCVVKVCQICASAIKPERERETAA